MTDAQTLEAIAEFAQDLENCTDMDDRKTSVQWLANKIGADSANKVAWVFGVRHPYYFVNSGPCTQSINNTTRYGVKGKKWQPLT